MMTTFKPNIIYIVCHDLGKHLNCYGAEGIPSPNLDDFATHGIRCDNFFCNSPCCSPSRGCAMTGQYAHTNGLMGLVNRGWSLPKETQTIVDYLNLAGYETAHFGFQHERYCASSNRYQIEGLPDYPEDDWVNRDQEWVEPALDGAIAYLERRTASDKPFYLNIGTVEVHASRWQGAFPNGNPQNRSETYGADPPDAAYMPAYIPDVPQLREMMGRFQGAIRFLDTQLQRLFNTVDHLGLKENTIIIFTTDHGIANERAKGTLYDRGVEITLLMQLPEALKRKPGVLRSGTVVTELIQNIDIVPTLLDAVGVEIPKAVQGKSFWPLLTGETYKPHQAIFIEKNYHGHYDPIRAVRTTQFHYIKNFGKNVKKAWLPNEVPYMHDNFEHWFTELWPKQGRLPRPKEELFDVKQDPGEFINLAQEPEYQDTKAQLAQQLAQWMRATDDPLIKGPIPDKLHPWPEHHAT